MEYLIDLFILFPHILHLLQLFDVGVFALLKHVLIEKIDVFFDLILITFRMQIKFQYLIELNHKF